MMARARQLKAGCERQCSYVVPLSIDPYMHDGPETGQRPEYSSNTFGATNLTRAGVAPYDTVRCLR